MKKSLLALAAFGLFAAGNAQAQSNTSLNAFARIIRPIAVSELEELSFGALYSTAGTQTVVITPNNATNAYENDAVRSGAPLIVGVNNPIVAGIHTTDASADAEDGDGIEQGGVRIAGEAGFTFHVTTSTTPLVPINAVAGATNMALGSVTLARQGGSGLASPLTALVFPGSSSTFTAASAVLDYNVGATMTVAANQAAGIYEGTITIAAAYN